MLLSYPSKDISSAHTHSKREHNSRLLILGELVEAVGKFEHEITRRDVRISFRTPLLIHGETAVAQFAQQIESLGCNSKVELGEMLRERHVPHQFIAVHLCIAIASVAIIGD